MYFCVIENYFKLIENYFKLIENYLKLIDSYTATGTKQIEFKLHIHIVLNREHKFDLVNHWIINFKKWASANPNPTEYNPNSSSLKTAIPSNPKLNPTRSTPKTHPPTSSQYPSTRKTYPNPHLKSKSETSNWVSSGIKNAAPSNKAVTFKRTN
jgi:hypothetical protein